MTRCESGGNHKIIAQVAFTPSGVRGIDSQNQRFGVGCYRLIDHKFINSLILVSV
jgi:hypothetical protein